MEKDLLDLRRRAGMVSENAPVNPQTDPELGSVLDQLHRALRGIDAADQTSVIPQRELHAVADAVDLLERYAREKGISLSEFQRPAHTVVPNTGR